MKSFLSKDPCAWKETLNRVFQNHPCLVDPCHKTAAVKGIRRKNYKASRHLRTLVLRLGKKRGTVKMPSLESFASVGMENASNLALLHFGPSCGSVAVGSDCPAGRSQSLGLSLVA